MFLVALPMAMAAQLVVSGTVYDSTKTIPVPNVVVTSGTGGLAITDSAGHYSLKATPTDSLTFTYNNKPTAKFAIKQIPNTSSFDISLHIRVAEKFKTMKEVRVYAKSFRQDSMENRQYYKKIFNYDKPGISSSVNPSSGTVGMDVGEFINIFRFRRNKQLRRMQDRLLEQEQESYIRYRFNKTAVKRITQLDGAELDEFMVMYKPDFEFTQAATTVEFHQYVLNAFYQYKKDQLIRSYRNPVP